MILTETKIPDAVHFRNRLGYDVVCYKAAVTTCRGAQMRVEIVSRKRTEGWIVESTRFHGPNMLSCKLVVSDQQTPLIGSYLTQPTL